MVEVKKDLVLTTRGDNPIECIKYIRFISYTFRFIMLLGKLPANNQDEGVITREVPVISLRDQPHFPTLCFLYGQKSMSYLD